ncbi:MAG TPA: ABC transporter substrate-binding protein [Stellaceae bacterium]|nr:ABC transporter substrate-binding protein [Stellaceae bacterium]
MIELSRRGFLKSTGLMALAATRSPLQRYIARIERDISTLDPARRLGPVEGNVIRAVCQGLVRWKPGEFAIELDAARSIVEIDPTRIDFTLQEGLDIAGFGPLTAEDVKFSFERFAHAGTQGSPSPYASDWAALDRVEVTGALSGTLHLKHPAPALWTIALADISGVILSRRQVGALGGEIGASLLGSGPFTIAQWIPDQRLTLTPNPAFRGPLPTFEEIELRPVSDDRTALLGFRAGELDFTAIDLLALDKVKQLPATTLTTIEAIDYVWIGLNLEKPPLDDPRVRRALRAAIDVDAVLLAAYDGKVPRARALLPPGILGHWAEAPLHRRDLDAARALLKEAGWERGFRTRITVFNDAKFRAAGEVVQANLAELGIRCAVDARDGAAFWSAGNGEAGRDLDLVLQFFKGKPDPSFFTQWFVSAQIGAWNWQRWSDPEFDRLHARAAATLDTEARRADYIAMQKRMEDAAAFIWLTHDRLAFAARPWLVPRLLPDGADWQLPLFAALG